MCYVDTHIMARLAIAIVRASALLAPRRLRAAWREEWLAEIAAARGAQSRLAARVAGAPLDALLLRWTSRTVDLPVRFGWSADARDAARALLKTPMQTATMVGCLAAGAAMMVTMFALTHALFGTGTLPGVDDRERVVRVRISSQSGSSAFSMRQFLAVDWNALPPGVEAAGGELGWRFLIQTPEGNRESRGAFVTGDFFRAFGTVPAAGRLIDARDDRPDAAPVAVISHAFWMRHYQGTHTVIGTPLLIGNTTCVIVGVAPEGFLGTRVSDLGQGPGDHTDVWLPMGLTGTWAGFPRASEMTGLAPATRPLPGNVAISVRRGSNVFDMVGPMLVARLAPGVTREAAEAQLQPLVLALAAATPHAAAQRIVLAPFMVIPLHGSEVVAAYTTLFLVPFVLLLIGCANVAGLQAARATSRRHELAVRTSLGASRGRLARLLMIEVFVTAAAGAFLAWAISSWALRFTSAVFPFHAEADWRVFTFALGLPVLITFMIGLVPSWRAAGVDVLSGLKIGGREDHRGHPRLSRLAVVTQIGLSVVLVFAAVMLSRGVQRGLEAREIATGDILLAGFQFNDVDLTPDAQRAAVQTLIHEAHDIAGAGNVAVSLSSWPRMGTTATIGERRAGFHPEDWVDARIATPEIFDLLGLRVIAGRRYEAAERDVMLVNEAFVKRHSSLDRVLGESFDVLTDAETAATAHASPTPRRVIGVVANEQTGVTAQSAGPAVYVPLETASLSQATLLLRPPDVRGATERLRAAATAIYPTLVPRPFGTTAAILAEQYRPVRWMSRALAAVGTLALMLAAVGLFAMVSASVSQRTGEFGVRLALGADPAGIISLVLREVARVAVAGLAAGLALSVPAAMLFRNAFAGSTTLADPAGFLMGISVIAAAMVIAAIVPARRAASVSPLVALKGE